MSLLAPLPHLLPSQMVFIQLQESWIPNSIWVMSPLSPLASNYQPQSKHRSLETREEKGLNDP